MNYLRDRYSILICREHLIENIFSSISFFLLSIFKLNFKIVLYTKINMIQYF